jgi:hypothetical protein
MKKSVIIVDEKLPFGLKANVSAILSMTFGKNFPDILGVDVADANGIIYKGITTIPVPILVAGHDDIYKAKSIADDVMDLVVIFNCAALSTKNYEEYQALLGKKKTEEILLHGILIYGDKSFVNKISGKFSLLK